MVRSPPWWPSTRSNTCAGTASARSSARWGGWWPRTGLVIAAHLGRGEVYVDELLGHTFEPFGGTFFSPQELREALAAESLVEEVVEERSPLPHEHPSERVYVIARRA
jgi:hypothetical protein